MLVLSRKQYEKILIGEDISIVVVEVRDNCVRLGIEAPREVPILRQELIGNSSDNGENGDAKPAFGNVRR